MKQGYVIYHNEHEKFCRLSFDIPHGIMYMKEFGDATKLTLFKEIEHAQSFIDLYFTYLEIGGKEKFTRKERNEILGIRRIEITTASFKVF